MPSVQYSDDVLRKDVHAVARLKNLGYDMEELKNSGYDVGEWDNPGKPLTRSEYDRVGLASRSTISSRFSSEEQSEDGWNQIKQELHLDTQDPNTPVRISDERLKKDVRGAAMAKDLGYVDCDNPEKPLTKEQYDDISGLASSSVVSSRFSSEEQLQDGWNRVKQELDLGIHHR